MTIETSIETRNDPLSVSPIASTEVAATSIRTVPMLLREDLERGRLAGTDGAHGMTLEG